MDEEVKYISRYLTKAEYSCKCGQCTGLPPDLFLDDITWPYRELFNIFDEVRATWGKPIPVSSGYRCPPHNLSVGGSQCSVHMFGLALDLDLPDVPTTEELYSILNTGWSHLRIGRYVQTGTFIHIDTAYVITPRVSDKWKMGARWYK